MVEGDFILIREYFPYKVVKRINISRLGGAVRLDAHEEMNKLKDLQKKSLDKTQKCYYI